MSKERMRHSIERSLKNFEHTRSVFDFPRRAFSKLLISEIRLEVRHQATGPTSQVRSLYFAQSRARRPSPCFVLRPSHGRHVRGANRTLSCTRGAVEITSSSNGARIGLHLEHEFELIRAHGSRGRDMRRGPDCISPHEPNS